MIKLVAFGGFVAGALFAVSLLLALSWSRMRAPEMGPEDMMLVCQHYRAIGQGSKCREV
jgi:hypothetical protein